MAKTPYTHRYPLIILILVSLVIFIWFCFFAFRTAKIQAEGIQKSECQYPLRTTNPPGACDNSDPCDPADAAKGGSGDCKPFTVELPMSHNAETGEKPVESVHKCE